MNLQCRLSIKITLAAKTGGTLKLLRKRIKKTFVGILCSLNRYLERSIEVSDWKTGRLKPVRSVG